jgi:hypothetical protein
MVLAKHRTRARSTLAGWEVSRRWAAEFRPGWDTRPTESAGDRACVKSNSGCYPKTYIRTCATTPRGVNKGNADSPKALGDDMSRMPKSSRPGDASHKQRYKSPPRAAMLPDEENAAMQLNLSVQGPACSRLACGGGGSSRALAASGVPLSFCPSERCATFTCGAEQKQSFWEHDVNRLLRKASTARMCLFGMRMIRLTRFGNLQVGEASHHVLTTTFMTLSPTAPSSTIPRPLIARTPRLTRGLFLAAAVCSHAVALPSSLLRLAS